MYDNESSCSFHSVTEQTLSAYYLPGTDRTLGIVSLTKHQNPQSLHSQGRDKTTINKIGVEFIVMLAHKF